MDQKYKRGEIVLLNINSGFKMAPKWSTTFIQDVVNGMLYGKKLQEVMYQTQFGIFEEKAFKKIERIDHENSSG